MEKFPCTITAMIDPAKIFDYVHIAMKTPAAAAAAAVAVVAVAPKTPVLSVDHVLSIVLLD